MDRDSIAAALDADHEVEAVEKGRKRTLGNVRLRHHETNELILIPTPSSDPNDPLNWYVSGFTAVFGHYLPPTGRNGTNTTWQPVSNIHRGHPRRILTVNTVICVAMMMCNFLAAGPSIAMLDITMDFFPGAHPGRNPQLFAASVAKVSYFFTTTALMQGIGNFIWVPIANKYGRRPVYVLSYLIYVVSGPPVGVEAGG